MAMKISGSNESLIDILAITKSDVFATIDHCLLAYCKSLPVYWKSYCVKQTIVPWRAVYFTVDDIGWCGVDCL
ncbi:hypothetical protein GCM10009411_05470 [Shewanella litoralis]|uniref:Uncharacterized protein n=1 Tax=Shewanella litoralis TaxID=2282700 RepID=A0ABQ2R0I5_9GAMM|nr:hypothetical protein GCM10009411_05470 [Shewanella litoralis]